MIKIKSINTDIFSESFFHHDSRAELICPRWFRDLLYALFCQLTPLAGAPLERIDNGNLVSGSYRSTLQSHGAWKKTRNTKQQKKNNPKLRASEFRLSAFYGAHCRVRRFSVLSYSQWGAQSTFEWTLACNLASTEEPREKKDLFRSWGWNVL